MSNQQVGLFTNKYHRTAFDDAEDLANSPSGGRFKMWFCGVALAAVPTGYGIYSMWIGTTRMFGSRRSFIDVDGSGGTALAIAYIAVGTFMHFHYFWGLHPRLFKLSPLLKLLSVFVFLAAFGFGIIKSHE